MEGKWRGFFLFEGGGRGRETICVDNVDENVGKKSNSWVNLRGGAEGFRKWGGQTVSSRWKNNRESHKGYQEGEKNHP